MDKKKNTLETYSHSTAAFGVYTGVRSDLRKKVNSQHHKKKNTGLLQYTRPHQ